MSTRGTYEFIPLDRKFDPTVTIYVHHDNYPEGAAVKLYDGFVRRGRGLAAGFLRGNLEAEHTRSHDAHGDTDYRYTVTEVKAEEGCTCGYWLKMERRLNYGEEWVVDFVGNLTTFIEKHGQHLAEWCQDPETYSPLCEIGGTHGGGKKWVTVAWVEKRVKDLESSTRWPSPHAEIELETLQAALTPNVEAQ